MNPQDVNKQIEAEYNDFLKKPFPGDLPDWLLDNFESVVMNTPQSAHQYFPQAVRKILAKKPSELTIFETSTVINLLLSVAPIYLGWSFETFLDRKVELQTITIAYNELMQNEEERLKRKSQALQNMGGQKNGMSVAK